MTATDVFRLVVCLGLLAVGSLIVLHMKSRLYDRKSFWLEAFVFIITLSAFLGSASKIGTNEPLVWYGAPMRAIAVVCGLIYIWKTREDVRSARARH